MADQRLLVITRATPWPPEGMTTRFLPIIGGLAREWDVTLLLTDYSLGEGLPIPAAIRSVPVRADANRMTDAAELRRITDALIASDRPHAVLLWGRTRYLLEGRPDFPPTVYDRVDSQTLTHWRAAKVAGSTRARLSLLRRTTEFALEERRIVRAFDRTVVVGDDDARVLRRLGGGDRVHVVPNGVIMPELDPATVPHPEPTVIFTGIMNYPPNVDAVCSFARDVWPMVRAEVPSARFLVAGRSPASEVLALQATDGIEVLGGVPSIPEAVRRAWVAVAPMRSGAGIKNKVLEAWASGRPVVMSRAATNGLRLDEEARRLVADSPASMAKMTVALLRDEQLRDRLGRSARERVARDHSWSDVAARMSALLDSVRRRR